MKLSAGFRLGPYEVIAPLGAGGMGEVYRARDTRLGREVAVKVLPERLAEDAGALSRFEREAKILAALSHPNLLAIHDFGAEGSVTFAVTELLEGKTLRHRLAEKTMPWREGLEVAVALAEGLAAAHSRGVVHRDLKPENVFLTSGGTVKILDFGLARKDEIVPSGEESHSPTLIRDTEVGTVMGTAGYMAPEQVTGSAGDARSDIFSFGCVLYEMLSGRRAFPGRTGAEAIAGILRDVPPDLIESGAGIPVDIDRVVLRCLEKDPEKRFQSARDLGFALKERATGPADRFQETPGSSPPVRTAIPRRRALVAGAVLLAVLGLLWAFRPFSSPARVRSLAVIPFENLGSDPTESSLADAITESLTTNIGRFSSLRVIARGAVVGLGGTKDSASKVGRSLGVDALVTGAVQKSGDQLRVNVQLVDVATGSQVWSAPFVQTGGNRFALQDRVSRGVLSALKIPLTAVEDKSLRTAPSSNQEAYDFYVRGRLRVRRENPDDNAKAIDDFEKAVALDSGFADAYAELAHAYGIRVFYFTPGDRAMAEKAAVACERALSLDPDSAQAHYAKGLLLWTPANQFPHEQAMQEYRRALALDPNHDDAHHQLGLIEAHIGLLDRAASEFRAALEIDPTNTLARHRVGVALLYELRPAEALAVFRETSRDFNPSLWTYHVSWTLLFLGRKDESAATIAEFRRLEAKDRGGVVASVEAIAAAIAGDTASAERAIANAVASGEGFGHFHHAAYDIGSAYALLGRSAEAVQWLRKASEKGFPCYPLFAKDPNLDRIRSDRAFSQFLAQLRADWEKRRDLGS